MNNSKISNRQHIKGNNNKQEINIILSAYKKRRKNKKKEEQQPQEEPPLQPPTLEEFAQSVKPVPYPATNVTVVNPYNLPQPTMFDVAKQNQLNTILNKQEELKQNLADLQLNMQPTIESLVSQGKQDQANSVQSWLDNIASVASSDPNQYMDEISSIGSFPGFDAVASDPMERFTAKPIIEDKYGYNGPPMAVEVTPPRNMEASPVPIASIANPLFEQTPEQVINDAVSEAEMMGKQGLPFTIHTPSMKRLLSAIQQQRSEGIMPASPSFSVEPRRQLQFDETPSANDRAIITPIYSQGESSRQVWGNLDAVELQDKWAKARADDVHAIRAFINIYIDQLAHRMDKQQESELRILLLKKGTKGKTLRRLLDNVIYPPQE